MADTDLREETMRGNRFVALVILSLLLLGGCGESGSMPFPAGAVNAQGGFSNASLQGPYGYGFSGFESGGKHVAAVGRLVLDGNGTITSGSQRRTEEGGFEFQFPVTGNYTVNPDGTGTLTMRFNGSVDTWSIVGLSGGQKARMVSIEPNNFLVGAVSGEMERQ